MAALLWNDDGLEVRTLVFLVGGLGRLVDLRELRRVVGCLAATRHGGGGEFNEKRSVGSVHHCERTAGREGLGTLGKRDLEVLDVSASRLGPVLLGDQGLLSGHRALEAKTRQVVATGLRGLWYGAHDLHSR